MKRAHKAHNLKRIIVVVVIILFFFENMLLAVDGPAEQGEESQIYKEAKHATYRKDWQKAAALFNKLKEDFPNSHYLVNSIYWLAYNIDKLSSSTENFSQQIELKREALKNLDHLIKEYGDSTWATSARILRIKISKDMVMRGYKQYMKNILQAVEIGEPVDDDVKMAALDALFQVDKKEAFLVLKTIFIRDRNPRLWEKALYWLQLRQSDESLKFLVSIFNETNNHQLKEKLRPHISGFKVGEASTYEAVIPVRVFYKGRQVDNLSKADFKLYEGKQKQTIKGFQIMTKRMNAQGTVPPRYFVLAFRITNYTKQIREGISYLFEKIMKKKDQLLVFINEKKLSFNNLTDIEGVYAEIDRVLREQSNLTRGNMDKYLKEMERRLNPDKLYPEWEASGVAVINLIKFLDIYREFWKAYKERYLLPDLKKYYHFARHLEKIKKEKWVINFYQLEMFPELAAIGVLKQRAWEIASEMVGTSTYSFYSRTLSRQLLDIDKLRNIADDFPVEKISKLFYKIDATFHTIFMHTTRAVMSKDFEYNKIATALEKSLRQIAANTGGTLIASNDLESALAAVGEKESTSYLLKYTPVMSREPGKVKVRLSNKNYKVIYDDNMRIDYINEYLEREEAEAPSVRLEDVRFKNKELTVVISNFLMENGAKGKTGRIDVRIRIKDGLGRFLFDQKRNITANRSTFSINLSFDWLQKGEYEIIVEVKDLLTGTIDTKVINPPVK